MPLQSKSLNLNMRNVPVLELAKVTCCVWHGWTITVIQLLPFVGVHPAFISSQTVHVPAVTVAQALPVVPVVTDTVVTPLVRLNVQSARSSSLPSCVPLQLTSLN